jgi:hypothetical protein
MSFMDMNFDMRNRFLIQKYSKNTFDEELVVKPRTHSSRSSKPIYDKYVNGRSLDNISKPSHVDLVPQHQPVINSYVKSNSGSKKPSHSSKISSLIMEQRKADELRIKKDSDKQAAAASRLSTKSGVPMKSMRSTSAIPFNYPFVVAAPLNEIDPNIIERQNTYSHHSNHNHRVNLLNKPAAFKQPATRLHFQPQVLLPQPPMQQQHVNHRMSPIYQRPIVVSSGSNFIDHPANGYHSHVNSEHYSPSGQYSAQNHQHQKFVLA